MDRPRISVSGLAAIVLAFAVGVAALRGQSPLWAGSLLLLDLATFTFATLAAVYREGARRAWWLGFIAFGWGYLAIAFGPWAAESIAPRLATSMLMDTLYQEFGPPIERTSRGPGGSIVQQQAFAKQLASAFDMRRDLSEEEREKLYELRHLLDTGRRAILEGEQANLRRHRQIIRASLRDFRQAGHCSVALLVAWFGGLLARVLYAGRGTRQEVQELPPGAG